MSGLAPWLVPAAAALAAAALAAARRRRPVPALALADAAALARAARRTALARAALALALVGLLAAGAALARRPAAPAGDLLARGASTVVVLDVSASVSDLVYQEIARTLQAIVDAADEDDRVGLVLFSDTAQEALPPGTRAAELEPFVRYFLPRRDAAARRKPAVYRAAGPGSPPETAYPLAPWFRTFSGGTRISTGLAAARRALERDAGGAGAVLLLSDLAEAEDDLAALGSELLAYAGSPGLALEVVALPPATEAERALFGRVLGEGQRVVESSELGSSLAAGARGGGFPLWLAVVAGLVAAGLAVNELAARPLAWGRRPVEAGP